MQNIMEQTRPTPPLTRPFSPFNKTYDINDLEILQDYLRTLAVAKQHVDQPHTLTSENDLEGPASEPGAAEENDILSAASKPPSTSVLDATSIDADDSGKSVEILDIFVGHHNPATKPPFTNTPLDRSISSHKIPTPDLQNTIKDTHLPSPQGGSNRTIADALDISTPATDHHDINSKESSGSNAYSARTENSSSESPLSAITFWNVHRLDTTAAEERDTEISHQTDKGPKKDHVRGNEAPVKGRGWMAFFRRVFGLGEIDAEI